MSNIKKEQVECVLKIIERNDDLSTLQKYFDRKDQKGIVEWLEKFNNAFSDS
jgi:hypothetical protein